MEQNRPGKSYHYVEKYGSDQWGITEWGDALARVGIIEGYWSQWREPNNDILEQWENTRLTNPIPVAKNMIAKLPEKVGEALHYARYHLKLEIDKTEKNEIIRSANKDAESFQ